MRNRAAILPHLHHSFLFYPRFQLPTDSFLPHDRVLSAACQRFRTTRMINENSTRAWRAMHDVVRFCTNKQSAVAADSASKEAKMVRWNRIPLLVVPDA